MKHWTLNLIAKCKPKNFHKDSLNVLINTTNKELQKPSFILNSTWNFWNKERNFPKRRVPSILCGNWVLCETQGCRSLELDYLWLNYKVGVRTFCASTKNWYRVRTPQKIWKLLKKSNFLFVNGILKTQFFFLNSHHPTFFKKDLRKNWEYLIDI